MVFEEGTIRLRRLDYILSNNDVNGLGCMYKTQTFGDQREGESYRKSETFLNQWEGVTLRNRTRRREGEKTF